MNNKKSAAKYLHKVVKNCRKGILHPQIESELLNELVNLLDNAQQIVEPTCESCEQKLTPVCLTYDCPEEVVLG